MQITDEMVERAYDCIEVTDTGMGTAIEWESVRAALEAALSVSAECPDAKLDRPNP